MPIVRLRILGESLIEVGESAVSPSATHLFSLLLYLCVERNRSVTRAELAAMLFDECETDSASHNLRQLLYRVRRLGVPLRAEGSSVAIMAEDVDDGMAMALSSLQGRPELRRASYVLLPHYCPPTAPLSNWLECTRDRVHRQLVRRLTAEMHVARRSASWLTIESLASASLELDPFNEDAILLRAEALARTGSKHEAVAILHEFEREVGRSADSLTIQPRILKRRISQTAVSADQLPEIPLIGRSQEMMRLSDSWTRALSNQCVVLAVSGEKSVGKSRILSEFQSMVRLDNSGAFLSARRHPPDRHRPMSLFADICKQLLSMPGAAGCSPRSISFLERLNEAPRSSALLRSEDYEAEHSSNGVRHAVIDLLESVCTERPLVCHVDDAQHLDEESLDLLRTFQHRLSNSPLLLLLSGECEEIALPVGASLLRLEPLDAASTQELATAIVARLGSLITQDAIDRCVSLSGGNPGHLEQLLSHVARTGDSQDVPADLLYLTDDRLNRLSLAALHTLQASVVYGPDCTSEVLSALTGLGHYDVLAALQELDDRSLIEVVRSGICCRSALVAERTLNSLAGAVRSLLHRRAARLLEANYPTASASQAIAWRIGAHWTQAGDPESALRWRQLSWRQLIAIGRPYSAIESIHAQLAQTETPHERAVLLDTLIEALQSAGDVDALHSTLVERKALSPQVRDSPARRCALEFDATEATFGDFGANNERINHVRVHLHSKHLDATRRARASRLLMIAADDAANPLFAREVWNIAERLRPADDIGRLQRLHTRLIYHTVFGSREKARESANELGELTRLGECSVPVLNSELNTSMAKHVIDATPPCFSQLEQRFDDCRNAGMDRIALRFGARIAVLLIDVGRFEDAVRWGRVAAKLALGLRTERLSGDYLTSQIDLALLAGNFERARKLVEQMIERAPLQPESRLSMEGLTYTMRIRQACQQSVVDHHVEALLAWHKRARTFGRHDDKMEVLWVALTARGEFERASDLLSEYLLSARRELRAANHQLRIRTAADPAWGRLASKLAGNSTSLSA